MKACKLVVQASCTAEHVDGQIALQLAATKTKQQQPQHDTDHESHSKVCSTFIYISLLSLSLGDLPVTWMCTAFGELIFCYMESAATRAMRRQQQLLEQLCSATGASDKAGSLP